VDGSIGDVMSDISGDIFGDFRIGSLP